MNNRCSGFLWLSILSIINFHRLSMPIDQFQSAFLLLIFETMQLHTNKFKSRTFVRTASAYTCGIPTFFWRQSMTIDELPPFLCDYRLVIDWPMPIDDHWLTRHRLPSIDRLIFRLSVSSIVQVLHKINNHKNAKSKQVNPIIVLISVIKYAGYFIGINIRHTSFPERPDPSCSKYG